MMVSHFYAQQMKKRPQMPLFIDSGGFAGLFEGAEFVEHADYACIKTKEGDEINPLDVLEFQEKNADIGATLDAIIPPGLDEKECIRRQRITIKNALDSLHRRLGDFWWHSLMLFCACRVADVLNAFVGLWLVPKYVGQSELGAVLPLSNFAMFIAIPASAFATVFMKEVNTLSTNGELGKMKTLVRGVFMVMSALLIISAIAAKLVLPFFLERLRIVEGMLGFLIIASAFAGCAAPVYSNVLQALKRFKEVSLINILAAPMRFAVMLCLMPFRALSGYFAGQTAAPMTNILLSVLFLRKYFRVRAEPYWNSNAVKKLSRLFAAVLAYQMFPSIAGLVEAMVIRQRLPEVESGAYYMVTRFY